MDIFNVTEGSRYVDCIVCGKPTDNFDGTRNVGCLNDAGRRVHVIAPGVYVNAAPLPTCDWHEPCDRRPVTGEDLCSEHLTEWRQSNGDPS